MKWKDLATINDAISEYGYSKEAIRYIESYANFLVSARKDERAYEVRYVAISMKNNGGDYGWTSNKQNQETAGHHLGLTG